MDGHDRQVVYSRGAYSHSNPRPCGRNAYRATFGGMPTYRRGSRRNRADFFHVIIDL